MSSVVWGPVIREVWVIRTIPSCWGICWLNTDLKHLGSPTQLKLHVDVPPISCSCINTIRLGRGGPGVPGAGLPVQPQGRPQPMAHLGGCVIWLPALQLLSHQPLHLLPVNFAVPAQSFILNTWKDTSWKGSFQTARQNPIQPQEILIQLGYFHRLMGKQLLQQIVLFPGMKCPGCHLGKHNLYSTWQILASTEITQFSHWPLPKGPQGRERERGSSRSQVTLVTEVTYSHLPHTAPEASKESKSRLGWIP